MKKVLATFTSGILAGMLISIAGAVYLSCEEKTMGAFLFGFGLLTVLNFKLSLYTGQIGYLFEQKEKWRLPVVLLSNLIGVLAFAMLLNIASLPLIEKAKTLTEAKLSCGYFETFIRATLCGIMMFIAVESYKKIEHPIFKVLGVFISVMIFILCGFEHCIADFFYFTCSLTFSLDMWLMLLIMILGNSVGSLAIYLLFKAYYKTNSCPPTQQ